MVNNPDLSLPATARPEAAPYPIICALNDRMPVLNDQNTIPGYPTSTKGIRRSVIDKGWRQRHATKCPDAPRNTLPRSTSSPHFVDYASSTHFVDSALRCECLHRWRANVPVSRIFSPPAKIAGASRHFCQSLTSIFCRSIFVNLRLDRVPSTRKRIEPPSRRVRQGFSRPAKISGSSFPVSLTSIS